MDKYSINIPILSQKSYFGDKKHSFVMKCPVVVHKNILADDMGCIEIMTFVNKKSCPRRKQL
ncbi:MAG: hypothetical protein IIY05_05625 [Alistipes sp.]|nr:hypothetical protein [Alistipes sp.]